MENPTLVKLLMTAVRTQGELLAESTEHLEQAALVLEHVATRHGDNPAAAAAILLRDHIARAREARLLVEAVKAEFVLAPASIH